MALKLAAQYKIATAIKEIAEAMKIDTESIDTAAALDWSAEALRQIAQQIKDSGGFVGKLPIHLCGEGEYNPETGKPTITTPEEDIFYLVPTGDSLGDDQFKAWVYSEDRWESWESMSVEIPQSDWAQTNTAATDYIKNKPAINAGTGVSSIAEGTATTASMAQSHAEGYSTTASGTQSHAEGDGTTASGAQSHAEGTGTTASGSQSHAEGSSTQASGSQSHAEGGGTQATGNTSHAEGGATTAGGTYSHAEGISTTASGTYSHAEGSGTTANHAGQHVFGEYNIADSSAAAATKRGAYVEIVGNGTKNNARSNARTLDWSGNEWLAGNLTAAGGSITIGSTTITEMQLQALLALLN